MEANPKLAIVTAVLLLAAAVPTVSAVVIENPVAIVVARDQVWTEDRTVERPVVVTSGSTLTIRGANVTVNVSTCAGPLCTTDVSVHRDAGLILQNATLGGPPGDEARWPFVSVQGHLGVHDSNLRGLSSASIGSDTGSATFQESDVGPMSTYVSVGRNTDLVVEDSEVHDAYAGFWVKDSSPTFKHNTFHALDYYGILVQQSVVGGKVSTTAPLVENNTFEALDAGVFTGGGGGAQIRDNRFVDVKTYPVNIRIPSRDTAIDRTPPVIEGNLFQDQRRAVRVYTQAADVRNGTYELEVHQNSFVNITYQYIEADEASGAQLVVDAADNWWGRPSGPVTDDLCPQQTETTCPPFQGSAKVVYDPWLTEPPPGH